MGRRRAERPQVVVDAELEPGRLAPVGAARVAWSYLGWLLVALLVGVVSAVAAPLIGASCDTNSMNCVLGWAIAVALLTAMAASGLLALIMKLGWEWWSVCVAALALFPIALDVVGPGGWALLLVTPALAAASTWTGPERPRWRPWVVGGLSLAIALASILHTFVL